MAKKLKISCCELWSNHYWVGTNIGMPVEPWLKQILEWTLMTKKIKDKPRNDQPQTYYVTVNENTNKTNLLVWILPLPIF